MKRISISAAMIALLMTACSNNEELITTNDEGIQTISAEIIQPVSANSSRVIVGGNPGDAKRSLTWRADNPNTGANEADAIYIYDKKNNGARFVYDGTNLFKRDNSVGSAIADIKDALCVPIFTGNAKMIPTRDETGIVFNFMNMMNPQGGCENAPMYGIMKKGILKFYPATGLLEVKINNIEAIRTQLTNENYPKSNNKMGIMLVAYDVNGNKKTIAAQKLKLTPDSNGDPSKATIQILPADKTNKHYTDIRLTADKNSSDVFYFPLITGEYGKFELTIHPLNAYKPAMTETVTIELASKKAINIEKKLYSISKDFTLKAVPATIPDK